MFFFKLQSYHVISHLRCQYIYFWWKLAVEECQVQIWWQRFQFSASMCISGMGSQIFVSSFFDRPSADHDFCADHKVWRPRSVSLGLSWVFQGFKCVQQAFLLYEATHKYSAAFRASSMFSHVDILWYSKVLRMLLLLLFSVNLWSHKWADPEPLAYSDVPGRNSEDELFQAPNSHGPRWFGGQDKNCGQAWVLSGSCRALWSQLLWYQCEAGRLGCWLFWPCFDLVGL